MEWQTFFLIFLSSVIVNNFVFSRFLGTCPYMGVTQNLDSALGMGMAVIFVMTLTSAVTWFIYTYFLAPSAYNILYLVMGGKGSYASFDLTYLRTIVFILLIAALVQLIEMFMHKTVPALYKALGIYLPLITTNCAVLGVAILNIEMFFQGTAPCEYSFIKSIIQGFGGGLGFTLAMVIMAGIRERLTLGNIPPALQGIPIAFVIAGLLAMAFMGFSGLFGL